MVTGYVRHEALPYWHLGLKGIQVDTVNNSRNHWLSMPDSTKAERIKKRQFMQQLVGYLESHHCQF